LIYGTEADASGFEGIAFLSRGRSCMATIGADGWASKSLCR